jgi:hypothetical protein
MRLIVFILFIFIAAPSLTAQTEMQNSSELEAYIAQIREWRMTESARMSLRSLANILSEHTILSFIKYDDSGTYGRRYQSTSCPNPNLSDAERKEMRAEYEKKINPILKKLHPLADKDNSGFVSEEEGAHLRDLIEFAYQALYVASQEGENTELFFKSMSINRERFKQRVAEYNEVLLKARELGLKMPDLNL